MSEKLRAAAKQCKSILKAQAKQVKKPNAAKLDTALDKSRARLEKAWTKAEIRVASEVDCSETTGPYTDLAYALEDAASALKDDVTDGLDPASKSHAKCSKKIIGALAKACVDLLIADADHIRNRDKDRDRGELAADRADAEQKFLSGFGKAVSGNCPTAATGEGLLAELENAVSDAKDVATISTAVSDDEFTEIVPARFVEYADRTLEPTCADGAEWSFWVKRGSVNKVVMYYQGGGACWNYGTCNAPTYKTGTGPGDNPDNFSSGFADLDNPENPFRDWHFVFVPYCTGDIHWGDNEVTYRFNDENLRIRHRGSHNALVAEKWARDHFVDPEVVFMTGSSAGAYGAIASSAHLMEFAYQSSEFVVLGDAGNGVVTQDFITEDLENWNLLSSVPDWIPALDVPIEELSLADLYIELGLYYPENRFGTYTSAYDGGSGGQTGFYNIMLNEGNPVAGAVWWNASCAWNVEMQALNAIAVDRAPNYRFYVGPGSSHTMWGRPRVYEEVEVGQPRIVDWVTAMVDGTAGWVNTECVDCGITFDFMNGDNDPLPPALPTEPFDATGTIVCP
ncbi:MAG: pectinacetylesterase family protein [Myxococcales bacterium]|nr:pectinacetylesterase family protein [Myxococcales bacterium]